MMKEIEKLVGETGAHYNLISSVKSTSDEHSHDFYEIFLVFDGQALHYVNGARQYLKEGTLVFIRPEDLHYYEREYEWDCQLINIAFSGSYCRKLFDYLDNNRLFELLTHPEYPVCLELPQMEKQHFLSRFEKLHILPYSDKQKIKQQLKSLILELVSSFSSLIGQEEQLELPLWLDALVIQMKAKENFAAGLPKMLQLACRTQEHLCREFKKHTMKTPTQYINELRLNYAKNLLTSTDINITDICFDSGFENLSHFYHLFRNQFGTSPANFRKNNRRSII